MEELSFGKWLSRYRKSLGLTQKQLAERVNCATITLRKIEAEDRRPSVQVLERLAQVLNIPPNQQGAFFHFGLGHGQPFSTIAQTISPWQISGASFQPKILSSLIGQNRHQLSFMQLNSSVLDAKVPQFNQMSSSKSSETNLGYELTHGTIPNNQDSIFVVVLVPLEVPSHLASSFLQNLGFDEPINEPSTGHLKAHSIGTLQPAMFDADSPTSVNASLDTQALSSSFTRPSRR